MYHVVPRNCICIKKSEFVHDKISSQIWPHEMQFFIMLWENNILQEPALLDSTFYKQQSTCATLPCCTNLICILATSCDTPSTTQDSKLPQLENLKKWTGNVQILCCYSEVFTWVGCSTNSLKDFWPYLESSYNI